MLNLCIKGTAISTVVEDVKGLVDKGLISRENLELRLEASDLALLEAKILPISWYDIGAYERMMELLRDLEGAGDPDYWFRRGANSAAHLIELGFYQQMEYLEHLEVSNAMDREERLRAWGRDLRRIVTLSGSLINFGEWQAVLDPDQPDRYRIEIHGITGVPEPFWHAAGGFLCEMMSRACKDWPERFFTFERIDADRVVYRSATGI
ncbi:MAG: hypothetical protein ACE5F1_08740 [Planctomycetota bacterium]